MQLKKSTALLFFVCVMIASITVKAQNSTHKSSFLDKTDFKIGYFGDIIWSNGLSAGIEYAWKEKVKIKERKNEQKTITHRVLLNGILGYTTNFSTKTENGLTTYYGIILRRVNPKGRLLNVELNPLGYYRSLLPTTYEVNGDDVSKIQFPGRGYYAPSVAIGIGKYRTEKTKTGWYLNLRGFIRTPYNAGIFSMVSLEYGYRFNFKNNSK